MMKTARFIFVFSLLSLTLCLFTAPALAQSNVDSAQTENLPITTPSSNVQINPNTTPNTNPDVPKNLHNWTQNVMIEVMLSLTCQLVGIDPTQPNGQCLGVDPTTGKIGFLPAANMEKGQLGGAIGGMSHMITALYTPPVHTSDYFQYLAQNFGIVKNAYAQGIGFNSLNPLMDLWSAFRNIVYLIFVLVFIVIGLLIMLRVRIDPRTVMTIQNQIPKIIIGILLVTFTFAIAGFLIDMMWVVMYLVFGLISDISPGIQASVANLSPVVLQGKSPLALGFTNGFGEIHSMVYPVAAGAGNLIRDMLGIDTGWTDITPVGAIKNFLNISEFLMPYFNPNAPGGWASPLPALNLIGQDSPAEYIINAISSLISFIFFLKITGFDSPSAGGEVFGFGVDVDPGWLLNIIVAIIPSVGIYALAEGFMRYLLPFLIVYLIVFIALFLALFRLWFVLLMAYINILIDIVLAPFWIIGSLVPGSPVSATGWLRDMIANLAAFPTVIFMFLLGKIFMDAFKSEAEAGNPVFVPPLVGDLSNGVIGDIGPLIGIGIILMTPQVVTMVKAALKAPKFDTGGLGRTIGAGVALPVNIAKGAVRTRQASQEYIIKGYDPATKEIKYGRRGIVKSILGRLAG